MSLPFKSYFWILFKHIISNKLACSSSYIIPDMCEHNLKQNIVHTIARKSLIHLHQQQELLCLFVLPIKRKIMIEHQIVISIVWNHQQCFFGYLRFLVDNRRKRGGKKSHTFTFNNSADRPSIYSDPIFCIMIPSPPAVLLLNLKNNKCLCTA